MKRILSVFLCAVLVISLAFCLAGCKSTTAADNIYFLNFKPEVSMVYEKIAKEYEKETGIKVKVVTAAANTYEQTLKSEIAKSNPPTIFQVNGPIGFASWKNYCADLTDSAIYEYLADKSLAIKENERVYAIPYVVEGYGIIYNNEIMEKYFALADKKSSLKSAKDIKSFSDLKTVVEDMTAKKAQLGIEGVFASTSLLGGEQWRWHSHLASIPLYYELREKHADLDPIVAATNATDIEFKYADNFKNIFDLYVNNSVSEKTLLGSKSVNDSMAEFATGKCAMVQNGTWAWSQISEVAGNKVKEENIGMLPVFMGISGEEHHGLCIGTENYLAVNSKASAEQQKMSLDFLSWLFGSEKGKKFVKDELKFATPFTTLKDSQPDDPLAKEMARYMNDQNITSVPWVFVGFPSEKFKTSFSDELLLYVQSGKSFDEIKEIIKNKWKSER
ncbi:MAG: ABC transporter substrate-binding protein [Ruminococcaceae bacterium]|nr:ABC transporter substrate-binding protein [Oscillospiraceae bacterium]